MVTLSLHSYLEMFFVGLYTSYFSHEFAFFLRCMRYNKCSGLEIEHIILDFQFQWQNTDYTMIFYYSFSAFIDTQSIGIGVESRS